MSYLFKVVMNKSVYEAAIERINFIYDEFEHVIIGFSGGKDSTVILELATIVAKERGRLPLDVLFIDQELEWQGTIDYMRKVMNRPYIKPHWLQIPMNIDNSTTTNKKDNRIDLWDESKRSLWMREKEDISIKENNLGTTFFYSIFKNYVIKTFKKNAALIGGLTAEESPVRRLTLTVKPKYKWVTWGKIHSKEKNCYSFYPIYDWSYRDVWKTIFDKGLEYNDIYNKMYQLGVGVRNMRISELTHSTALKSLSILQEIEPETWEKATLRLHGIDGYKHTKDVFELPTKLPYMFDSWLEYRDYLFDNLIDKDLKVKMKRVMDREQRRLKNPDCLDGFYKVCIKGIIKNDWYGTIFQNYRCG